MPGAEQAVNAAMNAGRGYEAVVLVVLMISFAGTLGGLLWKLWNKLDELQMFVAEKLVGLVERTTTALDDSSGALRNLTAAIDDCPRKSDK